MSGISSIFSWLAEKMVIERSFSVLTYVLLLFVAFQRIRKADNYKSIEKTLTVYLLLLTALGFFFIPDSSKDLYRWRIMSKNWINVPFKSFLVYAFRSTTPVSYLYIYLARLTGSDGVLPAFCSFVFHYNVFSILKRIYRTLHVSGKALAVCLLYFMCMGRMLEAISGVRSMVAIAVMANCFTCEMAENRTGLKTIIPEIISCLIHPMAVAVFAIRIFFSVFQKTVSERKKVAVVAVAAGCVVLALKFGRQYVQATVEKGISYLSFEHYSYKWEFLIAALMLLITIFTYETAKKTERYAGNLFIRNTLLFVRLLIMIDCVCVIQYSMFHRMMTFTAMCVLPLSAIAYEEKNGRAYIRYIKVCLELVMILVSVRGDLCGYRFF